MTYELSIAEAAEIDLYKAFLWYNEKEVELGEKFEYQSTNTIELIQKNPLHSQIRYSEVRVRFMDHFPMDFIIESEKIILLLRLSFIPHSVLNDGMIDDLFLEN